MMRRALFQLRRLLLPAAVLAAVMTAHFVWMGMFPQQDEAQAGWASVPQAVQASWLERYLEAGGYWMGYAYGLPLAFAVVAFRRYRERRCCGARPLAIGGVTLSGILSVTGCFLIGCCGSPMLGVYLSLLGAWVLPFAQPIIAAITTISIVACYLWLRRTTATTRTVRCPADDIADAPTVLQSTHLINRPR